MSPERSVTYVSGRTDELASAAFDRVLTGNLCQLTTRHHRHAFAFPKQFNEVLLSRASLVEYRADHSCASERSLM